MSFPVETFQDVLENNRKFSETFSQDLLSGTAQRGLAVVTCMDSRINPLALLGMNPGDAKILRNAGARVTDDVLRTLVLATYLLGVNRVLVMPHTDCRMAQETEADLHSTIENNYGVNTRSVQFHTVINQEEALVYDLTRVRAYPLLRTGTIIAGAMYDVLTGRLTPVQF